MSRNHFLIFFFIILIFLIGCEQDITGKAFNEDFDCPILDPFCEETIDIVVFYTPAMSDFVTGDCNWGICDDGEGVDLQVIEEFVDEFFSIANQTLENSLLPPNFRYRLLSIELFPYEERDNLKSDLMWLRNNPYFQSVRKSFGADVGLFLLGTQGYGGYAYSNTGIDSTYKERGVVVIDGYYFISNQSGIFETPSHELGHILGAGHLASRYQNPMSDNFGYHNQEPHYRSNEAFGFPVSQHNQKVYTIMGYRNYDNEYGQSQSCPTCTQLLVFSSPDLWWFFNSSDPLFGYCLIIQQYGNETVDLLCQGDDAWTISDNSYVYNIAEKVTLSTQELINRALPMGVDQPSYTDPYNESNIITAEFSTRNLDRVIHYWSYKANNAAPLAQDCSFDCNSQHRIGCSVNNNVCGDCLPGFMEFSGTCLGRVEVESDLYPLLYDESYENTEILVESGGAEIEVNIEVYYNVSVSAVEIYFATIDAMGEFDFSWIDLGPTIWVANEAPPHSFSLYSKHINGSETLIGTENTLNAIIQDSTGQNNHVLSYQFVLDELLSEVESLRLILKTSNEENTEFSSFGLSIIEFRVFGTSMYGCTDVSASNYDPDAAVDDGSCEYEIVFTGCTDVSASNYDPDATVDDGSCEYDIFGCTEGDATNYDPDATVDDGSCDVGGTDQTGGGTSTGGSTTSGGTSQETVDYEEEIVNESTLLLTMNLEEEEVEYLEENTPLMDENIYVELKQGEIVSQLILINTSSGEFANLSIIVSDEIYDLVIISDLESVSETLIVGLSIPENYPPGIYEGVINVVGISGISIVFVKITVSEFVIPELQEPVVITNIDFSKIKDKTILLGKWSITSLFLVVSIFIIYLFVRNKRKKSSLERL